MTNHLQIRSIENDLSIQMTWSVPSPIQFSLVFANVGGVTGVWPWTKVKIRKKNVSIYMPVTVGECRGELSCRSAVRA